MSFISFHNQYHVKRAVSLQKAALFNKQVNIKEACDLDTVLSSFALFHQQKSF